MVNGWTSPFCQPPGGVRQGCPLSPLLHVLCAEVLACSLRSAPGIVGVQLLNSAQELRVSGYADDTTVVINTDSSLAAVFEVYHEYELGLGAKLNCAQVQRDVAKCIETLPRPPSWFGLAQTSACTWCRAHYLHVPWRRGSREGGKKVGVVEGTQPFVPRQGAFPQCPCLASNLAHVCRFFHARLGCVQIRQSHLTWPFFWAGKRDLVARRTIFCPKFASGFGLASDEIKQVRCDYNGLGVSCPSSSCYKDLSAKPAPNDFHCSTRISCPRRVILKVGKKRGIWFWASERIFH